MTAQMSRRASCPGCGMILRPVTYRVAHRDEEGNVVAIDEVDDGATGDVVSVPTCPAHGPLPR